MALSLIRGKYVICKIRSRTTADVIEDGAVVQRDGTILAVGPYAALAQQYQPDETFGSAEHGSCLAWLIVTTMWV
jgi:5-methylthioadenosine/S-adenosylhomocysteine deaminase